MTRALADRQKKRQMSGQIRQLSDTVRHGARTDTSGRIHTHTRTHTRTHARTHTHTHTGYMYRLIMLKKSVFLTRPDG